MIVVKPFPGQSFVGSLKDPPYNYTSDAAPHASGSGKRSSPNPSAASPAERARAEEKEKERRKRVEEVRGMRGSYGNLTLSFASVYNSTLNDPGCNPGWPLPKPEAVEGQRGLYPLCNGSETSTRH